MHSNTTHHPPHILQDLGDGTFYYNFNLIHTKLEDDVDNYDYMQVRCNFPVNQKAIQNKVSETGSNHIVNL